MPSEEYQLHELWSWFDQPYGHEVPLILKNLYYSIHTHHAADANLPAFYVPHLSAIQLFPLRNTSGETQEDVVAPQTSSADAGAHAVSASSSNLAVSAAHTADGSPSQQLSSLGTQAGPGPRSMSGGSGSPVGGCGSLSQSGSPMLVAPGYNAPDLFALAEPKLPAPPIKAASAQDTSSLADDASQPRVQQALPVVGAWGAPSTAGSAAATGAGTSSWLKAVHGGGAAAQGATMRSGDAASGMEGVGGAWRSGKPSIGAGGGPAGGAWSKGAPRSWAAAVSTPAAVGEGNGGAAEAGSGKLTTRMTASAWNGDKQAEIEKKKLKCEEFLATVSKLAPGHGAQSSKASPWSLSPAEQEAAKGPAPLFEFFERRAPGDRPPLYDCVLELAAGVGLDEASGAGAGVGVGVGVGVGASQSKPAAPNPMLLEAYNTSLDLSRSWFAVAWYPILCHSQTAHAIRGSFITYHRLAVTDAWDTPFDSHYPTKSATVLAKAVAVAADAPGGAWPSDASFKEQVDTCARASEVGSSHQAGASHAFAVGGPAGVAYCDEAYRSWAALPSVVSWHGAVGLSRARARIFETHGLEGGGSDRGKDRMHAIEWASKPSVVTWNSTSWSRRPSQPHGGLERAVPSIRESQAPAQRKVSMEWAALPSVVTWFAGLRSPSDVTAIVAGGIGDAGCEARHAAAGSGSGCKEKERGALPVELIGYMHYKIVNKTWYASRDRPSHPIHMRFLMPHRLFREAARVSRSCQSQHQYRPPAGQGAGGAPGGGGGASTASSSGSAAGPSARGAAAGIDPLHMEKLPLERIGHGGRAWRPKSRHRDFEHIMETFPEYEKGLQVRVGVLAVAFRQGGVR